MLIRVGRRDNKWVSPAGCLMFSVYQQLSIDPALSPFLNYVVCIAITRAVKRLSIAKLKVENRFSTSKLKGLFAQGHEADVKIKWPNDIYYKDQKIGGVLLNSSFHGKSLSLIIGSSFCSLK